MEHFSNYLAPALVGRPSIMQDYKSNIHKE